MSSPTPISNQAKLGPYTPLLILHGGAGSITRPRLPPELYAQYATSLSSYVSSANDLLNSGTSSLDAACHAVSRMEDDPLFNCGKGAVFNEDGEIEMEASVMVASVLDDWKGDGSVKRGAAVSLIRETRHPIQLAKELLLQGDRDQGLGSMHCHLSGPSVEEWGWEKCGLERKGKAWFWTKKRWEEHLRGLKGRRQALNAFDEFHKDDDGMDLPSQGTVGAVCMDSWGNLTVATSTGGLTNKKPGRIGDTPTLGAGFWAESWDEQEVEDRRIQQPRPGPLDLAADDLGSALAMCLPNRTGMSSSLSTQTTSDEKSSQQYTSPSPLSSRKPTPKSHRRAIAMSGTGNGDSFLRTSAARTAGAMCRFGHTSLGQAVRNVAGYDGELQRSAGDRWGKTGEGEGGIIGIEAVSAQKTGHLVADFNCGGMWRAWVDEKTGRPRVKVFKEEYK
jgi:L-asparaginase